VFQSIVGSSEVSSLRSLTVCRVTRSGLFLEYRCVPYEEKDVIASPSVVREMVERYCSRSTPTVVIGSEVLIGFDPERIDELLAR